MWVFLSGRLRRWVLVALVLPVLGRVLLALGVRVEQRNPRTGRALTKAGSLAGSRSRRRRGR
jgi:hypothetical protein